MLSPTTKRKIQQIIPFGVIWFVFGLVYLLLEKGLLAELTYYPATGNPYQFGPRTLVNLAFITFMGFLVGTIEITLFNHLFNKKSLGRRLFFKTLFYGIIMIVFLLSSTMISNALELRLWLFDQQVWANVQTFFWSYSFWSVEIYIALIIYLSLFYSQVSENLGLEVLHNFFVGKYHHPTEEERIFMFLDMRSSTTIAEKLGHVQFFEMLKTYYADLSDPIIEYAGEVYQYVGDEIIVSWDLKKGLQNNNCLQCFFAMEEALAENAEKYQSVYGIIPTFKAGIHLGSVTIGEIGVIKKDIFFTGDVLNTTARIQGLCNTYQVNLLFSGQLSKKLEPNPAFPIKALGKSELRGREEKVDLFTIETNL